MPSISAWRKARAISRSSWRARSPATTMPFELAGRMDTELPGRAACASASMLEAAETAMPFGRDDQRGDDWRALVARHAITAVELAMELAGGARLLPGDRARAAIPRRSGRPLSPPAARPAGALCRSHGARPAGRPDLLGLGVHRIYAASLTYSKSPGRLSMPTLRRRDPGGELAALASPAASGWR